MGPFMRNRFGDYSTIGLFFFKEKLKIFVYQDNQNKKWILKRD